MSSVGSLNRRVTFQRSTVSYNDFNEPVETWATLAEVWVNRRDASAGESYRAQEVGGQLSIRFTIRYSSDVATINPRDRVLYNGGVYNITGVRETKRNRWLEVDAVIQPDVAAEEDGSP
jgi:SPP1 family predicted phage head-tail adaptor